MYFVPFVAIIHLLIQFWIRFWRSRQATYGYACSWDVSRQKSSRNRQESSEILIAVVSAVTECWTREGGAVAVPERCLVVRLLRFCALPRFNLRIAGRSACLGVRPKTRRYLEVVMF